MQHLPFLRLAAPLLIGSSILLSSPVQANVCIGELSVEPYAAADIQWRYMTYGSGMGSNVFKKNAPQGNVAVGVNFCDFVGIEGGYESTPTKTRDSTINEGEMALGVAPVNPPERHIARTQMKGWNLGLMGYSPVWEKFCVRLVGYLGMVRLTAFQRDIMIADSIGGLNVLNFSRTFKKEKNVLKLAVGLQQRLCANWDARLLFGFENTAKFRKLKSMEMPTGASTIHLKNTFLIGLGVVASY